MHDISDATKRNWARLGSTAQGRLRARANKSLSEKAFIPSECLKDKRSARIVARVRQLIWQSGLSVEEALNALCHKLLKEHGLARRPFVREFIKSLNLRHAGIFDDIPLPTEEPDLIGAVYQSLLLEGRKSRLGSYYTPPDLIRDLEEDIELGEGETLLDPCCGSGMFLAQLETNHPQNLYGMDSDPIAVKIAKANLFIRHRDKDFSPNIFCADFLKSSFGRKFDYIVSNPPWGARVEANLKRESFSCFLEKAMGFLRQGGQLRFLLPQSALSVRAHKDMRQRLLCCGDLYAVKLYGSRFRNVMSKAVGVFWKKGTPGPTFGITDKNEVYVLRKEDVLKSPGFSISPLSRMDMEILKHVYSGKYHTLESSEWALGIVTGGNKKHLLSHGGGSAEPIYTGREVESYFLSPPRFFIEYDRSRYQQVAPEWIYRAPQKLAYRFISDRLVFALDERNSLFLNSANILIPRVEGYDIKSVLALLNSKLFSYIHAKKFGQIKILKGNLMQLPFPPITCGQNERLSRLAEEAIASKTPSPQIDDFVYELFGITGEKREYIEGQLNRINKTYF
ncbi:MAG: N-6 DNA methylase [Clostridiales bacterium]|nr:N-6 DNA methylase [Clostridiales bacterium]